MKKRGLFLIAIIIMMPIAGAVDVNAVNAACPDFDKDNSVGFNDFFLFAESFDKEVNETNKQFDLDKNNKIGHDDFFIFAEYFGKDCGGVQEAKGIQDVGGVSLLPKKDDCENNLESCYQQISYLIAGAQKIAKLENGKLQYYHSDNLGSSSRITDDNGQVVFSVDYLPFGEVFKINGKEKYLYTGKELDEETGFYYYGARYYDPEIGRFTSLDPVPDGVNGYVYVRNNPMSNADPDGRLVWWAAAALGGFALGFATDVVGQVLSGKSLKEVDYLEATEAGAVGAVAAVTSTTLIKGAVALYKYYKGGQVIAKAAQIGAKQVTKQAVKKTIEAGENAGAKAAGASKGSNVAEELAAKAKRLSEVEDKIQKLELTQSKMEQVRAAAEKVAQKTGKNADEIMARFETKRAGEVRDLLAQRTEVRKQVESLTRQASKERYF